MRNTANNRALFREFLYAHSQVLWVGTLLEQGWSPLCVYVCVSLCDISAWMLCSSIWSTAAYLCLASIPRLDSHWALQHHWKHASVPRGHFPHPRDRQLPCCLSVSCESVSDRDGSRVRQPDRGPTSYFLGMPDESIQTRLDRPMGTRTWGGFESGMPRCRAEPRTGLADVNVPRGNLTISTCKYPIRC